MSEVLQNLHLLMLFFAFLMGQQFPPPGQVPSGQVPPAGLFTFFLPSDGRPEAVC